MVVDPVRDLLNAALALPQDERLRLGSELIASVEEPQDAEWDGVWLAELERRERAVSAGGAPGSEWSEVRARLVARLTTR